MLEPVGVPSDVPASGRVMVRRQAFGAAGPRQAEVSERLWLSRIHKWVKSLRLRRVVNHEDVSGAGRLLRGRVTSRLSETVVGGRGGAARRRPELPGRGT